MNARSHHYLRHVGTTSLVTGLLIVCNQVYGYLVNDPTNTMQLVNTVPIILYSSLNIIVFFLLIVSLIGLFAHQARAAGGFGLGAFLLALFGSVLVAGDVWFESFVVPMIAHHTPQLIGATHPLFIAGALLTFSSFSLGWILFGIASFRARVFSRWSSVLLMLGAAIGFLPLTTPHLVVFGLAIAWLGYQQLSMLHRVDAAHAPIERAPAI